MDWLRVLGYPLLLVSALELFLGILLLKQNPRNSPVNKSIAAFAIFSCVFSLFSGIMYLRASLGQDYNLFARLSWFGWLTVPAALQTIFFLRDEKSRSARVAGYILYPFWAAAALLALFTNLIVTQVYVLLPFSNLPGPLENPLRLIGGLLIIWLMFEIIVLRRKVTGRKRAQLNYFLYGTLIFGTGGSITAGFLQLLGGNRLEPGLSAYFSLPWVLLTFYAITRYRLFDIRLVISRILNILFLSIFISALQYTLFKLLVPSVGAVASIFISVPVIGIIFFGTPLGRLVQHWINELVLGDRYGYQKMLEASAHAMITILQRDELLRYVVESVRTGMDVRSACLYLRAADGRYDPQYCFGERDERPGQEKEALHPLVKELLVDTQQIIIRDELEETSTTERDASLAAVIRALDVALVIPLFSKGQLLGVLTLGERASGDTYLQSDIDVLQTLANHASIAIENARLFEEAGRMRASLKEREELFRTLAETTTAAIFIHQGGRFLYANSAGARLAGYSVEEFLGMDFWAIVHPDFRDLVKTRGTARLQGARLPSQYEIKVVRKDGEERWAYMTAGIIEVDGKPAVIGTLVDITDLKRAEEAKVHFFRESSRHYQALIDEQQRNQAEKEKILKDLHDGIGGLTTNINLLAELSRKSDDLNEIRRSLTTIADLSRESLSEIRGFIQSLDTRELSWHAIAAELRHLGSTIIEPHNIRFSIDTKVAEGDSGPSSSLSMNLFRIYKECLSNIIKHAGASSVEVAFAAGAGKVFLDIRDDGIGLGGRRTSGRGLVNMRTRAEEMGGALNITGEQGTRVVLDIPLP